MSDMRATDRILEWIGENAAEVKADRPVLGPRMDLIVTAITELRRRGDTLVRAADLRAVVERGPDDDSAWEAAIERLENALGGRMR